ncbi:MAG TPA: 3-isopropylmalate dehydratase large subunit [Candidatus Aminicenantes bacterium]|nr:3-isopropylmalate dehydratase large subunit [Candidatus Aminicenantes bacterium]
MSGKTVIEKIFARHTQEEVAPGKIVWIDLDVISARDFAGPNVVKNYRSHYGDAPVVDRERVLFTFDLTVPPKTIQYANNQQICREFAREQGIRVFDVERGIGTHTMMEEGIALPGTIVVGTDSHMNILGAVNCFGQGMGDVDIAFGFRRGRTWFEVPRTRLVRIQGKPRVPINGKDLALWILGELKTDRVLGCAVEFVGEAVEKLDLPGRITLLSMITEMGGIVGFIPFNNHTMDQIPAMNGMGDCPGEVRADPDATYDEEIVVDVSDIEAMVAAPPVPHNVCKVSELSDVKVDFGFIGSCTNGRLSDIEAAWKILKGRKIAPGTRLAIVPSTQRVYKAAMDRGMLNDLFDAGAIISNPGCGGCAQGHIGMTGRNEVMLSTGNRNFPGKQGDGFNYLTSPEVVAWSVMKGRLTAKEG